MAEPVSDALIQAWIKGQRIGITGGSGVLGKRLVRYLLNQGAQRINVFSRHPGADETDGPVVYFSGDVCEAETLEPALAGCKTVFHLAALANVGAAQENPLECFRVNSQGTVHLLEACRSHQVERIVYVSTCHVYGRPHRLPLDESHPTAPASVYAASKLAGENAVQAYAAGQYGLSCCIARLANLYGFYDNTQTVVAKALGQVAAGDDIGLNDLRPERDFMFIEDAVEALVRLAMYKTQTPQAQVVNVASGRGTSIREMASVLARVADEMGLGRPAVQEPATEDKQEQKQQVPSIIIDNSRLIQLTGWRPDTALAQGLTRALQETVNAKGGRLR